MQVVPLEAFRDKIPFSVAIAAVERGFAALGRGEAELPDPMVLELRAQQAEVHVKGAHLAGGRHIALKVATGFYRNRARGLPSGDGMFLLLDADTGVPAVLLEEHGYLTDFRTAAAVALTLKYLAPGDTREALLVGAGALARLTARAMVAQMPLARLTLWNRTRERAETLAKELGQAVETRIAPALESAVRDHRVIVTATASTTPLVMTSWVGPGTPATSVGTRSRRDRENPRPHDASRHSPPHRGEAMRGAHAGNRAGDRVGGAYRNTEMRGDEQRDGAARFGAEAAERRELGEPLSHRLDDAPAAGHGAEPHGRAAGDDDPRRHYARVRQMQRRHRKRGDDLPLGDQQPDDDPHRLLCVVGAVPQGICGRRAQLQHPEDTIHLAR